MFARSLLIIVVPVLLFQVVVTIVFVDNHWRKVTSRLAFAVAGEIAMFADMMPEYDPQLLNSLAILGTKKLGLIITAEPGRTLNPGIETSGTWEPFTVEALSEELRTRVKRPFSLSFGPDDKWANIGIQMKWGVFRVFALERRLFSASAYIFILWMVGSSIILFTIAVFFMRNQIRPIHRLAIAAERLGTGREIGNFKPEGAREVRSAARAFLSMHERIRRQIEQRTAMLAGISHDLRTPLTRLKLGLSMLGEGPDIDALKGDLQDMEKMINSYIDFVRGNEKEPSARTSINEVLDKCAGIVRRHGHSIDCNIEGDIHLTLRPIAFERVLLNLLSNAEKYGSHIWLAAQRVEDDLIITIDDNGPGLKPELREEVFKPFFRADTSRNLSTGGVGLGLTIAKDIILEHGGQLSLEESPHGGLRALIKLPF